MFCCRLHNMSRCSTHSVMQIYTPSQRSVFSHSRQEAEKDFNHLDGSQQKVVAKAILRVSQNPLPVAEGGYGKPLGNHTRTKLSGLLKVKLKQHGLRIVYQLRRVEEQMVIVVIGVRADDQVYKAAQERINK